MKSKRLARFLIRRIGNDINLSPGDRMTEIRERRTERLRSNGTEFERFSTRIARPKTKTPAEAFPKCPACLSSRLTVMDDDVFCPECGWDSIVALVDAGGFDIWSNAMKKSNVNHVE